MEPGAGHLRAKDWTKVSHGLDLPATGDARGCDELVAWALVLPATGAFTHLTSAREYGWWLPPMPVDLPVFACISTTEYRPRRGGLRIAQHPQPVSALRRHDLPFATPAETLLACSQDLGLLDMVVLIDAALHAKSCSHEDIADLSLRRRRGAPMLRKALRLADGRSESAWESLLRMLRVACGVPVEPPYEGYDEDGVFVARGDLRLVGTRTLHEYDGAEHRRKYRHRHDLRRERGLGNAGSVVAIPPSRCSGRHMSFCARLMSPLNESIALSG